ncbi:MAG TPA: RHS repeat protein, partial [Verrucomicrobiae bacterium]|nr:RHS repeat protein [Verrucomicrobiae bacterium]
MQKLETGPKAPKTPKALQFSENPTVEEIFQAHVFPEPLVVVGRKPTRDENSALAAALIGYSKRSGPDDFSALTDFLKRYPKSPWAPALLTGLGLEYYNTAHYSLAMDAWSEAWTLAKDATEPQARALADQALGELIYMKARLGRMDEIEELLNEIKNRPVSGPATEKVAGVREALWNMKNRPEIAFRCGPLALRSILTSDQSLQKSSSTNAMMEIFNSASTTNGFSLSQVAELSKKVGLNCQMAFREK